MGYSKLGRNSDQRKALIRDLITDLIINESIETTLSRAKELFLEWHSYLIKFLDRVKRVSENDKEKETFLKMNNALSESIDLFLSYVDLIT